MRGLSRPPSGHLSPVDALDAGRADARRLLRPPPLTASHHHGVLTPLRAAATAARGTGAPRAASRHGRSIPPPWLVSGAASVWRSRCRASARTGARADGGWHAASRSYSSNGKERAVGATPPRLCTAWRLAAPRPPHAGEPTG